MLQIIGPLLILGCKRPRGRVPFIGRTVQHLSCRRKNSSGDAEISTCRPKSKYAHNADSCTCPISRYSVSGSPQKRLCKRKV